MSKGSNPVKAYLNVIKEIAGHIRFSRYGAAQKVNQELIVLYFKTGAILSRRIKSADWGDKILSIISDGIQRAFPGIRGFSISNLKNMRQFYATYADSVFGQSVTGLIDKMVKSQSATGQMTNVPTSLSGSKKHTPFNDVFYHVGFTHHILLIQKCPALEERFFYLRQAAQNQWSVEVLRYHIASKLYNKKGAISSNFTQVLPASLKRHALEAFKDEYLLNYINVKEADGEEALENELVGNLRNFLMSLGREFAFLGNQYRIVVDDDEFFVDLLFYHRSLQSLVAIELKAGKFRPEYAGKMNFYLEALDQYVKLPHENPSIGIILCREKKSTIVEFAFKRVDRPMGVATYVLDDKLPPEYRKYLPTSAQLKKAAQKGPRT